MLRNIATSLQQVYIYIVVRTRSDSFDKMKGWFQVLPEELEAEIMKMMTEIRMQDVLAEVRWTGGYVMWSQRKAGFNRNPWCEHALFQEMLLFYSSF